MRIQYFKHRHWWPRVVGERLRFRWVNVFILDIMTDERNNQGLWSWQLRSTVRACVDQVSRQKQTAAASQARKARACSSMTSREYRHYSRWAAQPRKKLISTCWHRCKRRPRWAARSITNKGPGGFHPSPRPHHVPQSAQQPGDAKYSDLGGSSLS